MMEEEVWKDIPGYDGHYQASSLGRVRSNKDGSWRVLSNYLAGAPSSLRHTVMLYANGRKTPKKVHQLVLEAFVGPRPSLKHCGCHNDGNPYNNRPENLRWDTMAGNMADKKLHGTHGYKLTEAQVLQIKERLHKGHTNTDIARDFGISLPYVSRIKNQRAWSHI